MMRDGWWALLLSLGFLVACAGSAPAGGGSGARGLAGRTGGGADSGSSSDDDAGPGSSSGADGGSGAAISGGSCGGAGSSLTRYAACVRYVDAECNRFDRECRGGSAVDNPCPYKREFCPDVYFAEGSLQTVDDLVACADTWAGHSCQLARKGIRPECHTVYSAAGAGDYGLGGVALDCPQLDSRILLASNSYDAFDIEAMALELSDSLFAY